MTSKLNRKAMVLGILSWLATVSAVAVAHGEDAKPEAGKPGGLYREQYRPQFHFTPKKGWMNDPNGMLFYQGEYHLFFQCDPDRPFNACGIKYWGHAVSSDMLHWTELDNAIEPDAIGSIWSGSGVVDWNNTTGFQAGVEKPLVCIYTSAGGQSPGSEGKPFVQSITFSNDRGRTWTKYEKNPVLNRISGENRDPKVFWHAPSKQWIMALYLEKNDYALFGSPNLKEWTRLGGLAFPGNAECPDFFELPVDGDAKNTQWVFWGANNTYLLGSFDGKAFRQESGPYQSHWGEHRYAAQTFNDMPAADGRRIQIAWMAVGDFTGMPFNQQMSVPVVLSLRTFPEGVRICTLPVKELDTLHGKRHAWKGLLRPGDNPLAEVGGDLFDIRLAVEPGKASEVGLKIRGVDVQYRVREKTLSCMGKSAPVELVDGRLTIQALVDRTSIELFAADGRVNMAYCFRPAEQDKGLTVYAKDGDASVQSLDVWELKSTWPAQSPNR